MGDQSLEIVGICRFSYLATRGWKKTVAGDPGATAAALYDDDRMAVHFEMFETLCLPSVLGQSDAGLRLMVLASPAMPETWRNRLEGLLAPHDRVSLQYLRPRPMVEAVGIGLKRTLRGSDGPVAQFILDDDDAIAVDYGTRLRRMAKAALAAGIADQRPLAINFPRGLTLSRRGGDFKAQMTVAPFLAQGLALLTDGTAGQNVFSVPHLKTAERHRAWSDPEPVSYLRAMHDHHDSRGIFKGRERDLTTEDLTGLLSEHFPFLDADYVLRLFGGPLRASGSSAG